MEPPMMELDWASAKRRRRTRYTPLPGIMENAVYLTPSVWPPTRRARGRLRDAFDCVDGVRDGKMGRRYPFLGANQVLRGRQPDALLAHKKCLELHFTYT